MSARERTFRVFISSTFTDMVAERNALQQRVFPALRRFCEQRGARFQAVDLRWGVSEEAAADQKTMLVCLEELRRCQRTKLKPNFIVLLGDRYGWRPLPPRVPAPQYDLLLGRLVADEQESLHRWYRRDDNAAPPEYVLQPRAEGFDEGRLVRLFWKALEPAPAPISEDERAQYVCSATHQEIRHGALQVEDAHEHVFAYLRTFAGLPEQRDEKSRDYTDYEPEGGRDLEAKARLEGLRDELRTRLPEEHLFSYQAAYDAWPTKAALDARPDSPFGHSEEVDERLGQLCAWLERQLTAIVEQESRLADAIPAWEHERHRHERLARECSRHFVGREQARARIVAYLDGGSRLPLVVRGPAGSGKTSLLGYVALQSQEANGRVVVLRFLGATPAASDPAALLRSLLHELAQRYDDRRPVPIDIAEMLEDWPRRLALASAERPLTLILDGLDQLARTDEGASLGWLFAELPPHVKLVVSILDGASEETTVQRWMEALPAQQVVALGPLEPGEGAELLDRWLKEAGRRLQPGQLDEVLGKFAGNRLPLYLRLAFEEARQWSSYGAPVALAPTIPAMARALFAHLAKEVHHGAVLVEHALGSLAAARHGLAEDELLEVLSRDGEVRSDFRRRSPHSPRVARLPDIVWARLYSDLDRYLIQREVDGGTTIAFFHRLLADEARARYLAGPAGAARHAALAAYFFGQADPSRDGSWSGADKRGFSELAYHYFQRAAADDDPQALYLLADDRRFRTRQFEVLGRMEPLLETMTFALARASGAEDLRVTVRYALARAYLTRTVARTFLYRLTLLAEQSADLARSVAQLVPDPRDRLLALALIAWVLSDDPQRHAAARRLLHELQQADGVSFTPWQVPAVLAFVPSMIESGVAEAAALLRKIPDCPLRRAARDLWAGGPTERQSLAAVLAEPPQEKVEDHEWRRAADIAAYVRRHWHELSSAPLPQWEEGALARLGPQGAGAAWIIKGAEWLARGQRLAARLALNRGLYLPLGLRAQPIRVWSAMARGLSDCGDGDLAAEYRDRLESWGRARQVLGLGSSLPGLDSLIHPSDETEDPKALQAEVERVFQLRSIPLSRLSEAQGRSRSADRVLADVVERVGEEPAEMESVARWFRMSGQRTRLFQLVRRVCARGVAFDVVDACLSQLVASSAGGAAGLRSVDEVLEAHNRLTPVASGLGIYYTPFLWTYLLATGSVLLALGSAVVEWRWFAIAVMAMLAAGAIGDLLIWSSLAVWQRPERSRRTVAEAASFLAFIALLIYGRVAEVPFPHSTTFAVAAASVAAVLGLLAIIFFFGRGHFLRDFARSTHLALGGCALAATAVAAVLSATVAALSLDFAAAMLFVGAFAVGVGLNLLIKHVPVRWHYRARKIRVGDEDDQLERLPTPDALELGENVPPELEEALLQAQRALQAERHEVARQLYAEVLDDPRASALSPTTQAMAHVNRGIAHRSLGAPREALADYQEAARLHPSSPRPPFNAGLVLGQDLRRFAEAEEVLTQSLLRDPNQPDAFSCRAVARAEQGKLDEAEADLETALALDPSHANALSNLASVLWDRGDFGRASELFGRALDANPDDPELRFNYAIALMRVGATAQAREVLESDPRALQLWQQRVSHRGR